MKIQILFLKKNDVLGRIIKSLTQGRYSHCCTLLDSLIVCETDFIHNFNLSQLKYKKCDYDTITLDLKDSQYYNCLDWITENVGVPYDNFENWRYLLGKKSNGQAKLNCVEATISMLCDIGYLNPLYLEVNLSPTQLYELLIARCNNV